MARHSQKRKTRRERRGRRPWQYAARPPIITGPHFAVVELVILRCPNCGQANNVPPNVGSGKKAVCGKCKTPLTTGKPVELSDANFRSAVASGKYVVDFWAGWCGPCRMIAPILDELAAARTDITFGKLDVDRNPSTAAAFHARSIPLLVFLENGVEKGRVVGAVPRGTIEAKIAEHLG